MKNTLLGGVLLLSTWGGLTRIHDRNEALRTGAEAYRHQNYAAAAAAYKAATLSLGATDDRVWLNLAHATARTGQQAEARGYYSRLVTSKTPTIRSVALQQLAALAATKGDYVQAVGLLRQALVANPANADARYNYEVLRNFLHRRAAAPPPPPPGTDGDPGENRADPTSSSRAGTDPAEPADSRATPQARPDAAGQPNPNQPSSAPGTSTNNSLRPGAGEQRNIAKGNQPGSVRGLSDTETGTEVPSGSSRRGGTEAAPNAEANIQTQRARLQQMNISSGQARQLLEALHAAEQQYLQQLPRKATHPPQKGKPGW
ncbi:hypothetical protein K3G63_06420 [Hymenobacter sp. HSC-4F20]|uniref:hypothetical protein n=1 Tax=Hymenobacter sp. HSC-4F20 TaxID=2864135 RepID=UPI001C73CD29|nr:hypothetical protein [Hymenobacter sp. HSC-4F20]MBX0290064.1 hypothetical protein [Hymenobacter sp. HSC-4F20]